MQAIARDGHIKINISASAQNIIKIIFSDDGLGIPEQNFQKIFEPFFLLKIPHQEMVEKVLVCILFGIF